MYGQLPDDELMALAGPGAPGQAPGGVTPPATVPAPQAQAAAPQVPVVAQPAAVPSGTHAVKGVRTNEALVPSPELQAGAVAEQKVIADERKLAGDEAATQTEAARIQAEAAQQQADETARRNAEIQAEQQYQADQQEIRNNKWLADLEAIKSSKAPGGFETWPQEKKVRGYLSVALAGLARGSTGGTNVALAQINKQVEDARKAWTQDQELRFKALEATHGFNAQLDQQARDTIAQGYARKAMAIDSLSKQADAQLKALGIPVAQQAGIKAQLGLDKQAADAQMKYGQIVSTKTTDATHFVPGGAGVGGGGKGVVDLVKMAENGSPRSAIVAAAQKIGLPEKVWKNQVDLAFVEREKALARGDIAKDKAAATAEETEVPGFDGSAIGNTAAGRSGLAAAAEARKRVGNAQALVAQLDKAIESINRDHTVIGIAGFGSEAYKERQRLLAGVQSKARVFSELPASEGGLALEHAQIGSINSASAKQLRALREDIIEQTNLKNRSLLTSASKARTSEAAGAKKPSPVDAAIDAQAAKYGL